MAWLSMVGYGISAGGQIMKGYALDDRGEFLAKQLRERANSRKAVAQRDAADERRKGAQMVSRGAVAIASQGGDLSDAGSVVALARLEAEKEYRAMSILYVGYDEAEGMEMEAEAAENEGEAARTAGWIGAAATVMSGAGSWYAAKTPKVKTTSAGKGKYSPIQHKTNKQKMLGT